MRSVTWKPTWSVMAGLVALSGVIASGEGQSWKAAGTYELPPIPLADFLFDEAGILVASDHGVKLGGIGSDLWHGPEDGPGVYWMITDRGPNGLLSGPTRRTFPVEAFTPFILQVRTDEGRIDILQAIPITGVDPSTLADGVPVGGVSNAARDETPWDCPGTGTIDRNPNGLDTEGLARAHDGTFWVAEEYSPSILHIGADGQVETRYMPADLPADTTTTLYPSEGSLPAILGKRKVNRGFEGLTLSPDRRTAYVAMQSPLLNPTTAAGNASLNIRIIAFDTESRSVIGEYVYRFEDPSRYPAPENNPSDIKVSGLAMLDARRMLVLERVDALARIFVVDLQNATNILDTVWDSAAQSPSLEQLSAAALDAAGVATLPKHEIMPALDSTGGLWPAKIEGLTVLDGRTIAIANDNDFGVGTFGGPECTLQDTGRASAIRVVRLDSPIK
jgi:Esterase-like activity of phytase